MASASYIKGITIKIDGDTNGLAKDLQSVNSDIKKTQSALKDVEKALKLDPGNVELLEQKQQLLNKQIEQTAQKLELEQQAAAKAADALEAGTITQEEYASLTAEIATTASQLEDLEGAAQSSADSMEETGSAAADAGQEAEQSGDSFVNWGDVVKGAATVAATAVAAVGTAVTAMGAAVVEGTGYLVDSANDVAAYGDAVDKTSQKVGMSTEAYQKWDYIMKINGSSMDENIQGFKTLTNALDDARNGADKAVDKFAAVGLSMDDLAGKSREEVFEMVIMSLQNMTDETQKAAAANDLLGRSSMNLAPLLNGTNDDLQTLSKQAEDYGIIMSDDLVADTVAYTDSMTLMESSLQGLKNRLVGEFLPGLTEVTTGIAGMAAGIEGSDQDIQQGVNDIVTVFEGMIPTISSTIEALLPSLLTVAAELITTIATGVIANLPLLIETAMSIINQISSVLMTEENLSMLLDAAVSILLTLVNGLIEALDMLIDPALQAILTLVEALLSPDNVSKLIDAAIHIILSLLNGLTDAIPKLIPVAVEAIQTIVTALLQNIDKLIFAAGDLIMAIISGCWEATPKLAAFIITKIVPEILKAFGRLATQLPKQAGEWGADLIEGLVNGIKSAMGTLTKAVKNIASTISSYLHFSEPDIGPLAKFHTFMPDMIDMMASGIRSELPILTAAVNQTAGVIAGGTSPDYSGQLSGISTQLAGMGGNNGTYVINVQVGSTTLATAVISAQQMEAFRCGGV